MAAVLNIAQPNLTLLRGTEDTVQSSANWQGMRIYVGRYQPN